MRGERTFYDGATSVTATPTRGLATRVETLNGPSPATAAYKVTQTASYDVHGRVVATTRDPEGVNAGSSIVYTPAAGWPVTRVSTFNAVGHSTTVEMDGFRGLPVRTVDVRGGVTEMKYDALGRVVAAWGPDRSPPQAASVTFRYEVSNDAPPAVETRRLVVSGRATEAYVTSVEIMDGLLRPRQTQTTDATGSGRVVTDTLYDSRGLAVESRGAYAAVGTPTTTLLLGMTSASSPAVTRTVFDGAGRVVSSSFRANNAEQYREVSSYAGDNSTVSMVAGSGAAVPVVTQPAVQTFTDALGQVTRVRTFRGAVASGAFDDLTYGYSAMGELTQMTDQGGNQWVWEYDIRGQQVRSVDPDRGVSTAVYDTSGRAVSSTDGRGQVMSMRYDTIDRPLERWSGAVGTGVRLASWGYDAPGIENSAGLLTSSTRYANGRVYEQGTSRFDVAGRPLESYSIVPPGEGSLAGTFLSGVEYTSTGQVARETVPATPGLSGETREFVYNSVGLVESVSGVLAQADYTSFGEVSRTAVSVSPGRFLTESREYEVGTRRLVGQVVSRVAPRWGQYSWALPADVRSASYAWTPAGDVWGVRDTVGGVSRSECYRFDGNGRVSGAWASEAVCPAPVGGSAASGAPGSGVVLSGVGWYQASYAYDGLGNRVGVTQRDGVGSRARSWSYPVPGAGVVRPHGARVVTDEVTSGAGAGPVVSTSVGYSGAGGVTDRVRVSASGVSSGPGTATPAVAGSGGVVGAGGVL